MGTRARDPVETAEHEVGAYAASYPLALTADGSHLLLVDYGEPGIVSLVRPTRVSGDGRLVYVRDGMAPARIDRIEILTGRRTPWRVLGAESRAGISQVYRPRVTPDGEGYAYGYGEWLQDLYLVEGLRF